MSGGDRAEPIGKEDLRGSGNPGHEGDYVCPMCETKMIGG